MPQSTIIVTSPKDPTPKWPEGYPGFRGIALSPRDAGHPDDASVSVHSNAVPVMSTPPSIDHPAQKDDSSCEPMYTRSAAHVNRQMTGLRLR